MATSPDDLWRGVHESDMARVETQTGPVIGVLNPTLTRKKIGTDRRTGADRFRDPDVTIIGDMVQKGGGTSLFNRDRVFRGASWNFFFIPEDTPVPPELILTGPDYNPYFEADHYQIEVAKPIPVAAFLGALDNLARAAFAKRYVDARRVRGPGE